MEYPALLAWHVDWRAGRAGRAATLTVISVLIFYSSLVFGCFVPKSQLQQLWVVERWNNKVLEHVDASEVGTICPNF